MAELADVEQSLVNALIESVYPNGMSNASAIGVTVRIYRGRPTNAELIANRLRGAVDISVCPLTDATRNTTRWPVQVTYLSTKSSLTVGVSENSASFSGTALAGDLAGVLVNDDAFVYQAQADDSAALVASSLGNIVRKSMICTVSGSTIIVPSAYFFTARTASAVQSLEEWARQEQGFQISLWAPTPALRDSLAQIVVSTLTQVSFLPLPDGTGGRLRYRSTAIMDGDQAASIYRRDLNYDVEYGSTIVATNPTMLFVDLAWNGRTVFA